MSRNEAGTDLRVRRTRKLLREALVDLATEKGFEAVTIQDIAERAMVNRATFYRHYQDKYALALDYATELLAELDLLRLPLGPERHSVTEGHSPALLRLFEHAAAHERLYRLMLGRQAGPFFAGQIQRYIEQVMRERLEATGYDPRRSRVPPEFCFHFLANNALTLLVWWLEQGRPYTAAQMAAWLPQLSWRGVAFGLGLDDGDMGGAGATAAGH